MPKCFDVDGDFILHDNESKSLLSFQDIHDVPISISRGEIESLDTCPILKKRPLNCKSDQPKPDSKVRRVRWDPSTRDKQKMSRVQKMTRSVVYFFGLAISLSCLYYLIFVWKSKRATATDLTDAFWCIDCIERKNKHEENQLAFASNKKSDFLDEIRPHDLSR